MSTLWPLEHCWEKLPLGAKRLGDWVEENPVKWTPSLPWQLLDWHAEAMAQAEARDGQECREFDEGTLLFGAGTKVLPGVYVEGTVIVGENCKIGPNCYLRGPISIGNNCHVGQAVELKNAILGDGVNVGHLSYVGDSVLGPGTNFGAGTITSNLRHDGGNHRTMVDGELVNTGRRKFGVIIGANVHTGINTSLYPGRKIGSNATTLPGQVVDKDLPQV